MGEGTGWIDGDDADGAVSLAIFTSERSRQRALAGTGRAGDPDDVGAAAARKNLAQRLQSFGVTVLDKGDDSRQRSSVALKQAPGTVKSAELEKEKGTLVWSFDIANQTGGGITEVLVSALDGHIVETKAETAKDEAAEKAKEAKEAKKTTKHKASKHTTH